MVNSKESLQFLYENVTHDKAKLMEMTTMPLSTFYRSYAKLARGEMLLRKKGSGRPRLLTGEDRKSLSKFALQNPLESTRRVTSKFNACRGKKVSHMTVYRSLKFSGIVKKLPKKVPNLTRQQELKRLNFCQNWNVPGFFDNVFLTDECSFQLHRNTVRVWSSIRNAKPTKKVPKFSPKLMVWGALSKKGFYLHIYENNANVNSSSYQDTLLNFIPFANELFPEGWILQQDGATPHTSTETQEFFSKYSIQILQWPPNSPDLSAIENVWQVLKIHVEKKNPQNLNELRRYIWESKDIITPEMQNKLLDSTYSRLEKCTQARGKLIGIQPF